MKHMRPSSPRPESLLEQQFLDAYDQYADAIYRHCFFRVYAREKAEDIMQEAFTKTWNYLRQGKRVDNMRAFLYRVANNLIIDASRKKTEESLERVLDSNPQWEPVGDDGSKMQNNVLIAELLQSMERLPIETRQLLTYRYVDDLEPREIADILQITPNHVSVKLSRAIQALRSLHQS